MAKLHGSAKFTKGFDGVLMDDNVIKNLIRVGHISSVNGDGTARVVFDDKDNMVSADLQLVYRKTLKDKEDWMLDVGEQVVCLFLPSGLNAGYILGAVYSKNDRPPVSNPDERVIKFADGAMVTYNRAKNEMIIETPGVINIKAKQINVSGKIVSGSDILAQGISHTTHTHGGVTPGGGHTGKPD